jgi:hypothetical protein
MNYARYALFINQRWEWFVPTPTEYNSLRGRAVPAPVPVGR